MQNYNLIKGQWTRVSLFIVACALSVFSIITNKVIFALLSSLFLFFAFLSIKKNPATNSKKEIFKKYELTSDQLILSLALFFYSLVTGIAAALLSPKISNGTIATILLTISIGLLFSTGIVFDRIRPCNWNKHLKTLDLKARRNFYLEIGAVTAITLLALMLRVTYLDRYPTSMHGDEGEMGMEALRFLGIGEPISPLGIGWGPLPNLFYLWQAGFIAIFGRNLIGLRLVSALFGIACIPLVYMIGKKSWGKLAGFTGAWLIAISSLHIQYSRLAINNIHSLFFMLLFFMLFLTANFDHPSETTDKSTETAPDPKVHRRFKITPYIAMGVTGALAQYTYLGSRLIPLVAMPVILYLLIRKRINFVQISIMIISALLVFAPLGLDYLRNPDQFSARMGAVSIFNPENIHNNYGADATLSNSIGKIIISQFDKNLGFFVQSGDRGSFYYGGIPGFDFITIFLFWLGLGAFLARPQRLPEMFILIWFFLGVILAGVLTNDSPNSTRLLIITAVVYLAAGAFIQQSWDKLIKFYRQIPNIHISLEWIFAPIVLAAIVATFVINYNYNFVVYPKAGNNILSITVAEEINTDAPTNHIYLFGIGNLYANHGTLRFLAGEHNVIDITKLNELPTQINDGKGVIVLATYENYEEFAEIATLYPQGKLTDEYRDGHLIFKKFQIPAIP